MSVATHICRYADNFQLRGYEPTRPGVLRFTPYHLLCACLIGVVLFVTGLALLAQGGIGGYLGAQALIALVFLEHFVIQHECGQRGGGWHALVGHYASLFSFLPFYPWQCVYAEHHLGRVRLVAGPDPAAGVTSLPRFFWAWCRSPGLRVWVPLFGVLRFLLVWTYPVQCPTGISADAWRRARWASALSIGLLLGTYLGAYAQWPDLIHPLNFAPAIALYLLLADAWVLWSVEPNEIF